jgi:hypothetical protein
MANLSDRITNDPCGTKTNANLQINGGFDIWQRGLGFTGVGYTADRWWIPHTVPEGFLIQSGDITPDESAPYSALVAPGVGHNPDIYTTIELSNPADGPAPFTPNKDYVLSFWAKRSLTDPFKIQISYVDAVGSAVNQVIILDVVTAPSVGSDWAYYTIPFNIGAFIPVATNLALQLRFTAIPDVNVTDTQMNIALVKLEVGVRSTTFTRAGNTLAGELAMCQRYYQSNFMGVGQFNVGGTAADCYGVFPVTMRVAPTVSLVVGSTTRIDEIGSINLPVLSITPITVSPANAAISYVVDGVATGSSLASVRPTASFLNVDAEL